MKSNYATTALTGLRQRCARLALAIGLTTISILPSSLAESKPSGGEFPGIVSFQRISSARPGGGGGDIIVFDIVDSATRSDGPAGGDIIVFDIVDSVAKIYVSDESSSPGVYEATLVEGKSEVPGLVSCEETEKGKFILSFIL